MATYPESIVDKNGKATTVHKSAPRDLSVHVTRVAPTPKQVKPHMRTYDEMDIKVSLLEGEAAATKDEAERAQLDEQAIIIQTIMGFDEDDMMTDMGAIDYFRENYNEDSEFFESANAIEKWLFNKK